MTRIAARSLLNATALLVFSSSLISAQAQVIPTVPPGSPRWIPKPPPLPIHELGGILLLDVPSLKRSMNVYQQVTVPYTTLYGRPMRVKGYKLDATLRRQWPNIAELSRQGATLTLTGRTATGEQSIEVQLDAVYGKGGVLAYAEAGQTPEGWPDASVNGQVIPGQDVGIYLVWPQAKKNTSNPLPEIWQISRIILNPTSKP